MIAVFEKKYALGKKREKEEEETNFGSQGCTAASGRQPKIIIMLFSSFISISRLYALEIIQIVWRWIY